MVLQWNAWKVKKIVAIIERKKIYYDAINAVTGYNDEEPIEYFRNHLSQIYFNRRYTGGLCLTKKAVKKNKGR